MSIVISLLIYLVSAGISAYLWANGHTIYFENRILPFLLVSGLLPLVLTPLGAFLKKRFPYGGFPSVLDFYQGNFLGCLAYLSPGLYLLYVSLTHDTSTVGMFGNLAGGLLLTGILSIVFETYFFAAKQKPKVIGSLTNNIYRLLCFMKEQKLFDAFREISRMLPEEMAEKLQVSFVTEKKT